MDWICNMYDFSIFKERLKIDNIISESDRKHSTCLEKKSINVERMNNEQNNLKSV